MYNIVLPNINKEFWEEIISSLSPESLSCLETFQELDKVWPGQVDIPEYCLYLGSYQKYDLYSYRNPAWLNHYSTAIVFGNEGGDYMSGWIGLQHLDHYKELWEREFYCGLLRSKWLKEYAISVMSKDTMSSALHQLRTRRKNNT